MSSGGSTSSTLDSCLTAKSSSDSVLAEGNVTGPMHSSPSSGYLGDHESIGEDSISVDEADSNDSLTYPTLEQSINAFQNANMISKGDAAKNSEKEKIGETEGGAGDENVDDLPEGDDISYAPPIVGEHDEKQDEHVSNLRRKRTDAEILIRKKRKSR